MDKSFTRKLLKETKDHEEWLQVIQYGWKNMIEDKKFLMEMILEEAERERQRRTDAAKADYHLAEEEAFIPVALEIMKNLGVYIC